MKQNDIDSVSPAVLGLIEAALKKRLANQSLRSVDVTPITDSESDSALSIDVQFDLIEPSLDAERFQFLTTDLRNALEEIGERRFPHLRYHFDERQKVSGWR